MKYTISIWPLLCTVLIVLKALGKITMAWGWVLAPVWIPLCIVLPIGALCLYFYHQTTKSLLAELKRIK
jgi:hypothetical protein